MSNGRNLGLLLGTSTTIQSSDIDADLLQEIVAPAAESYNTSNDLPASGNQVGDQVFVADTNRLYIWTGAGWYNIALINQTPTWDSGGLPEAAYELDSIGGTATSIVLSATDPDGLAIQWTYSITDSGNDLATITNDSNGTFTITAKSLADILNAGYDSSGGTFDVTFRASDGVNLATALSEFTIVFALPYSFQGSNYGYTSGGRYPYGPSYGIAEFTNIIDKFSFAADANATDVGDLFEASYGAAGQSSAEYGYVSGGGPGYLATINKFSFSTDGNATDVGDLTLARSEMTGQSSSESGYTSGGGWPHTPTVDKFPFATDANATDVGDLTQSRYLSAGQSSSESGYTSGGRSVDVSPNNVNTIDKFPFATDANATDVGNLTVARWTSAGQSSSDYGYTSGGTGTPVASNVIDKFPFATDANATDVGDLIATIYEAAGQSSTDYGYATGGRSDPAALDTIQKFSFTSDGNASDVANLTVPRMAPAGQQY
jgi:hypothetical protein